MVVTVVVMALIALSPVAPAPGHGGPVTGGGGPDAYGYRYLDSDTTCPGAPTYNWIEIKGAGTRMTGLGDDNVVGPFSIGFEFPYYWYKVRQIFCGSNGYIAFHDNSLAAPDFNPVPGIDRPNNTLAALMADMDPSTRGSCWYWTSADADTFIVQFDSVPFWSTGGSNTFQIILSRPDSSITFQYKEQQGQPSNGWIPTSNQCGIENISGQIGLNYLSGNQPVGNMYHAELAVRFFPPDQTTMQIHDAGVRNAMNDRNGGFFVLNNQPVPLWFVAMNFGNQPEQEFKSYAKVRQQNNQVIFQDSAQVRAMNPGETDSIVFPNPWTPTTNGVYTVEITTKLSGDAFPPNDSARVECHIVTLPATLTYDKGTPDAFYSWNGPGGYGCRFVPPVYPCSITSLRFYAQAATATQTSFALLDDNGSNGNPGDTLFITQVNVSAPQWYSANTPSPVVITEGAFFVGAWSATPSLPQYAMDSLRPISGQTWEYTNVWAPSRELWVRDAMMNVMVGHTGINEWLGPGARPITRIEVNPNPLVTGSRIRLLNPPAGSNEVEVFDAAGCLVRTLQLKPEGTAFDGRSNEGRRLADGIYFCRLAGTESPVAKLVISR